MDLKTYVCTKERKYAKFWRFPSKEDSVDEWTRIAGRAHERIKVWKRLCAPRCTDISYVDEERAKSGRYTTTWNASQQLSITAKVYDIISTSIGTAKYKICLKCFMVINLPNIVHANITCYKICWMFMDSWGYTTSSHLNYMDLHRYVQYMFVYTRTISAYQVCK